MQTFKINLMNGSILPVEVSCALHPHNNEMTLVRARIFGEHFQIKFEGGNHIVTLEPAGWNRIKKQLTEAIPAFASAKLSPKQPLGLRITDAEKARYEQFVESVCAPAYAEAEANKQTRLAAEAAAPHKYAICNQVIFGDYNITEERYVAIVRKNLRAEGWVVVEIVARFDEKIGAFKDEWYAMIKNSPALTVAGGDFWEISKEDAHLWVNRAEQMKAAEAEEAASKQAARDAEKVKAAEERAAKFEEAKQTGKPVLLGKYFLSGSDIPKQYREEESDMGHLCVFAMPDGSTKEEFSHSY